MPIRWTDKDGAFEIDYFGPFSGLHVQAPENIIPDTATPFTSGFMFRNAELRSAPTFQLEFIGADNNNLALGQCSFPDANGITHTVQFTTRGLWQLSPSGAPPGTSIPWQILGGPSLTIGIPVSYRTFANILYYTNGGTFLASWDGIAIQPTASNASAPGATSIAAISAADAPTVIPGSTGPLSIGALYLSELDNHLLLANVTVLDNGTGTVYSFPQRLWWSANGIPNQWDPTANVNAGENDFLDVPDQITGIVTIGIAGFLFRTNGITQFTPTGNGVAPFQFDHLWASDHGVGNAFPWSIASYGAIACFVSVEQIYSMSVSTFTPIGGTARDAIMSDLARLSGGVPVAQIVPALILGYTYMTYIISIPLATFTRHYVYSIEEQNWSVWDTQGLLVTGRPEECWTGILATFGLPGVTPPSTSAGTPSGGGGAGNSGNNEPRPQPPACFSGNVKIKTPFGFVAMQDLDGVFEIENETGVHQATMIVHFDREEMLIDMGKGNLVTSEHVMKSGENWIVASEKFKDCSEVNFRGNLYNLHIISNLEEDRHYILENGAVAHNFKAYN